MSNSAALVTVAWWRVLGERLLRQAAQTAGPVLAAVVAAGGVVDLRSAVLGLAGVEAVTLAKATLQYLADVHFSPDDPWWVQVLDRAVPAAAGVLLGVPLATWADAVSTDWSAAGKAAGAAAVLALVMAYGAPGTLVARSRHRVA